MSETPVSTFRLDDLTKARLAQLAESEGKTMTDMIKTLVARATQKSVTVLAVETRPEYDHYVNLPGHATETCLRIDPRDRTAYVVQAQKTGSTPMTLYHGLEMEYSIFGHPDEDELRAALSAGRGQDHLRNICDGWRGDHDGRNFVGHLTDDAIESVELLEDWLNGFESKYEFWEAGDWLNDGAEATITAETTDEELASIAKEFAGVAESDNIVLDEDMLSWLTDYRSELQDN